MAIAAIAKLVAPTLAREALEGGVTYAASRVIGRSVSRGLASAAGQRVAGRVTGERVAGALASQRGQKYVSKFVAHEVRDTVGDVRAEEAKPAPMPTTPVSEQEANPNLVQSPVTPGSKPTKRQRQQGWQDNGVRGSRFGGGGGWWNAASITDPMKAGYDWRTLSDTSVARGPSGWNMAGKGTLGRAVGFAEGYRGAQGQELEPHQHSPEEIAQINENLSNTWPVTKPTSRSEAFTFGSNSDLGYGSRNPVGPFSSYPRPPQGKPVGSLPYDRDDQGWIKSGGTIS